MKFSLRHSTFLFRYKILLLSVLLLFSINISAQVGINTANPDDDAILDVYSSSAFSGGLFLPLLELTETTLPDPLQLHVAGMFVYNTNIENDVVRGIYYNDGNKWVTLSANSIFSTYWTLIGNEATNPEINFLGTTDAKQLQLRTKGVVKFKFGATGGLHSFTKNRKSTISWVNDTRTGFFFTNNEDLAFTTNDVVKLGIKDNQILVAPSEGTPQAPSYSWKEMTNTGIWAQKGSGGHLDFSVGGSNRFQIVINSNHSQLQQIETSSQSAGIPTYSWSNSKSTGLFMPEINRIGFSTNGIERIRLPDIYQIFAMFNGTYERPFYSWHDSPGTGFFTNETGSFLGFSVDEVDRFRMTDDNQLLKMDFENQSEESPSYSWEAAFDTGMYSPPTEENSISISVEGSEIMHLPDHDQILAAKFGIQNKPTYAFISSPGTGMWSPGTENLGFSSNEIERFRINNDGQLLKVDIDNQKSSQPAFSWLSSPGTGFYMPKDGSGNILSNTFSISTGSNERVRFPDRFQILGASSGSEVKPFLSWNQTPGTGIELVTNESIAFSIQGDRKLRIHDRGSILFNQNANLINGRVYSATKENENNGIAILGTTAGGADGIAIKGIAEGDALAGKFQGRVYHTGIFGPSDRRFKKNINILDSSEILVKIKQLRPVSYQWNTEEFPELISLKGETSYGFIAQEFKEVFPELVSSRKRISTEEEEERGIQTDKEFYSINYIEMIPIITAGVQAQNKQLKVHDKRLEILERKVAQLMQKENQE